MENYIVRIYRREAGDPYSIVGTVECVETNRQKPFHGLHRLGDLLACGGMSGDETAVSIVWPAASCASTLDSEEKVKKP